MITDPNSPQVIASRLSEQEAAMLVGFLDSQGIDAHIFGANSSISWPELPENVSVLVRQSDLNRTQAAMTELRLRHTTNEQQESDDDEVE